MSARDIVLLCGAPEDAPRVTELRDRLERAGVRARAEISEATADETGGAVFAQRVEEARLVIVCFSRHAASMESVISAAQRRAPDRPFLVPVRLDDCTVPAAFRHLQHVDLFEQHGFERVVALIEAELSLLIDPRDGRSYRTVELGGRTWLAENLDFDVPDSWRHPRESRTGGGAPYGRLYTWDAAHDACPGGWHLPDDGEWQRLARSVGGYRDMDEGYPGTGMKIGTPGAAFEALIEGGGSGFAATLAGYRTSDGDFDQQGAAGLYWSGTPKEYVGDVGRVRTAWIYVFYTLSGVAELRRDYEFRSYRAREPLSRSSALSVRCVRDE